MIMTYDKKYQIFIGNFYAKFVREPEKLRPVANVNVINFHSFYYSDSFVFEA
jgi:hypothetical protein